MATLLLSRIQFQARHGVSVEEQQSLRTFEVDVTIETQVSAARESDALDDTIDYRKVAEIIVTVGTAEIHHLIESLAGRMLDRLHEAFPLADFCIELRKLSPPGCPGQPAFAAVRMSST